MDGAGGWRIGWVSWWCDWVGIGMGRWGWEVHVWVEYVGGGVGVGVKVWVEACGRGVDGCVCGGMGRSVWVEVGVYDSEG